MFNMFYLDYYFMFVILFILFISFCSNSYDLCYKYKSSLKPINLYTIINLTKLAIFFKIICIIFLNLAHNDLYDTNFNFLVSFKLVFFIFMFFYLQYFYQYSKLML